MRSYLRFDVQGLAGAVSKATLRIWANSGASAGWRAYGVSDNTWSETRITYATAPPLGSAAGSSGPVAANTWTQADVTALVAGSGTLNLAIVGPGCNGHLAVKP